MKSEKRIIFHLPLNPDINRASASNIRPWKMLNAFKEIGYNVDVVMGNGKARSRQIRAIKEKIANGYEYDFLYSESSTMPTMLTEPHHLPIFPLLDFGFFKFCKDHAIKIGLFYRDIYWCFDGYTKETGKVKAIYAKIFYRLDLLLYAKHIDLFYLPSKKMTHYLPENLKVKSEALPPGISIAQKDVQKASTPSTVVRLLYVGGLGQFYDLTMICKIICQMSEHFSLTICCREEEWRKEEIRYLHLLKSGNISTVHKKGNELEELYQESDIACLFLEPHEYRSFAMPMKLFEYIEFSKPILSVANTAASDFVTENNIGWACSYDEAALKQLLLEIINGTTEKINEKIKHIEQIKVHNTWIARAKKVAKDLIVNQQLIQV